MRFRIMDKKRKEKKEKKKKEKKSIHGLFLQGQGGGDKEAKTQHSK